ncbi:MAG: hypothetical protein J6L77_08610 [Coprococcus sp.]|nr:hypothetical protein [Coprococcus sp.]
MDGFMNKMQRKFGRYAVRNLSLYIMIGYVIGYLLYMFAPDILSYLTLVPSLVMKGQVWRLVTWVITPPRGISLWVVVALIFYYSIGTQLEKTMGAFLYNIYIFGGMIVTMVGSMLTYIVCHYMLHISDFTTLGMDYDVVDQYVSYGVDFDSSVFSLPPYCVSTYYIMLTIFLAIAVCYPNMTVLYAMIIPIKMKWLSIIYLVFTAYEFKIADTIMMRANIVLSLLSFAIFYLSTKNFRRFSPKHIKRRRDYKKQVKVNKTENVTHKCAVCGITDKEAPDMQFRYCSKCKGNKEYCQEHLFTHTHV